jgi:hypothetical protein
MTEVGGYWGPSQTYPSKTILTRTDALPATDADDRAVADTAQGIPVSQLRKLDTSGMKIIAVKDVPELRDLIATAWLRTQATNETAGTDVPDNAPQNIYATVEVGGKVVATLYNGGSCAMTNAAAATAGDLPNSGGGPDLAQSRRIHCKGCGWHDQKSLDRDHPVAMDSSPEQFAKLYARATRRRLPERHAGKREGRGAAGCGLSNHAGAPGVSTNFST